MSSQVAESFCIPISHKCLTVAVRSHQHLVVLVFWMMTKHVVIPHCSNLQSLVTYDIEDLCICLFGICTSLVRWLFRSFACPKLGHSFSYCWVLGVLYIFWITVFWKVFSPRLWLLILSLSLKVILSLHLAWGHIRFLYSCPGRPNSPSFLSWNAMGSCYFFFPPLPSGICF